MDDYPPRDLFPVCVSLVFVIALFFVLAVNIGINVREMKCDRMTLESWDFTSPEECQ